MSTSQHTPLVQIALNPAAAQAAAAADSQAALEAMRNRVAGQTGQRFWRSLEELSGTSEFQRWASNEFPDGASTWSDSVGRRRMLQLLGASLGLAGLTACTKQPEEKIVPYVQAPEDFIAGKSLKYASAVTLNGYAQGVLVESHLGRPTKVEGNDLHPASLGGTDIYAQAAPLVLYDPDRSQTLLRNGRISTWPAFVTAMGLIREEALANKGAGLSILTENTTSPTLAAQMKKLLAELPQAKWRQFDSVGTDNARAGAQLAFGQPASVQYNLAAADVILSLDADFLTHGPGAVRYAKDFGRRRKLWKESAHGSSHAPAAASHAAPAAAAHAAPAAAPAADTHAAAPAHAEAPKLNRLYVVESCPTSTGSIADHRLPLASAEVENYARALAAELGVNAGAATTKVSADWVKKVAADLKAHSGASAVIAGDCQPPAVHALAHAINAALGNIGKTVSYTDPVEINTAPGFESLQQLVADMNAGKVKALIILGGNPVYTAPADLDFAAAMKKVATRVRLGLYDDETSALCQWHVPDTHSLETWTDLRAFDGTITIAQPLIAPIYGSHSAIEIMSVLLGRPEVTSYQAIREHYQTNALIAAPFEDNWRKALHDGILAGSALPAKTVAIRADLAAALPAPKAGSGLEINFRPDGSVYDGRFANNGWLQELPKPISRITWDNAAYIGSSTAAKLGLGNGDLVELKHAGRRVQAPIWIMPGHAADSVTVTLGYGRTRVGRIGNRIGYNAGAIRTSAAPFISSGLEIAKTGDTFRLATTQEHHSMEGRDIIRVANVADFEKDPQLWGHEHPPMSLYEDFEYKGYKWGMAIDLSACTGCNACTIACHAENNIAVVGKSEILRGREMHWIRIDRYYEGDADDPGIYHQPLACQHCENAPCEGVCPVAATTHSEEGLNQMVYNRCIGTRYCSNNCPYKVRRFNFFLYSDWDTQSLEALRNPNVTVRSRGVMEKCTYCVQRINSARIEAEKEGRKIRDGEVITACQSVCPTEAITFGDLNDPNSKITRSRRNARNYKLLGDLNTRPRTEFLARVRNPNPELAAPKAPAPSHG
ncbi:MAG: TAT-variant-translocated molybdopterin oxidoreductase [Bryobacterales bacterium]|nr:TAT-variant-translocated molybdopterin oxidoreductase [Bryobacterales bacterium]